MRYKKVLVTGADGFIGSHLTEMLVRQGYDVRAFVLYNSFNSWGWLDDSTEEIKRELDVFAGDIRDPYGVRKAMEGCDAVLNLAALIAIPYSYHSPDTYVDTNVKGALNVVQAARDLGVSKIVQTSTSEVYGTAQFVPITEEHPLHGQSPYSASKIGADQIAMSFYNSFGTPVALIRPFNTYGPRQSARAVIPTIITQIASGKRKIKLGALSPTRDFNFVKDTARGFISVMESDKAVGEVINIGSNFEVSIGDTARIIAEAMDTVYGTAQFVPITEEHPLHGQSPYSASKIGADQIAMSFYNSFGTPVALIRPFNTYGPRQSARAVIPTIITQIASGKRKIKLGALSPTRDFNFVKDTARGFISVMESDKAVGEVINIGSNFEVSIGDTARIIAEAMDTDIEIETDEIRLRPEKSEVNRLWADNSKAKRLLDWEPEYGGRDGFRRGLKETAEWFTNLNNLRKYKTDIYNI